MMRATRATASCLILCVLGCGAGDARMPQLTAAEKTLAGSVEVASLKVTERELKVQARSGPAGVTLSLIPRDPPPLDERMLMFVMNGPPSDHDAPRPCAVRILDRDGELLREDGTTMGMTDTRPIEDFDADMRVAEALAVVLTQNEKAWQLYRWELHDVRRTSHELIGLRGPTQ